MDESTLQAAQEILNYRFNDPSLLGEALTHASVADARVDSNERLEFLGDAVLGMIVCDYVYTQFPDLLEGDLTKIKSAAVSRRSCAKIARAMGLDELLRLGKGMSNRQELPSSLSAAVFESIIGAIYLDSGFEAAREFVLRFLKPVVHEAAESGHQHNFKSILQQHAQKEFGQTASYILLDESGPDHAKSFQVCVDIGGRRFPCSWGASKKQAEQAAALHALIELGLLQWNDSRDEVVLVANGEVNAE